MPEQKTDQKAIIIFVSGVVFLIIIILLLVGVGKYTSLFRDKAVELMKETAPEQKEGSQQINSADSPYLQNLEKMQEGGSVQGELDVAPSPADYGFQMDIQKAAQQQDTIEKYSIPSTAPGQPGSKEWQEQFWKDR